MATRRVTAVVVQRDRRIPWPVPTPEPTFGRDLIEPR
jgi:hypothetical protein